MKLASLVTRVAGLWILFGGTWKLLYGSPADIPLVRELPVGPLLAWQIVITVEFLVGGLLLFRPRVGWVPGALLLGAFVGVLGILIARGEPTCGCIPGMEIPPAGMLAIDGTLLVLLLASRPWRLVRERVELPLPAAAVVLLGAAVLPWIFTREAKGVVAPGGGFEQRVFFDAGWEGQVFADTTLAAWLPEALRTEDGLVILWLDTCEVCATLLEDLAVVERGDRDVVLLEMPREKDAADVEAKVHTLPEGFWVKSMKLPDHVDWFMTPPVRLEVAKGIVISAKERVTGFDGP